MIENSMVVFNDCDNPYEEDHLCHLCADDEDFDEDYDEEE